MITSGIEPGTFRLVAHCLNQRTDEYCSYIHTHTHIYILTYIHCVCVCVCVSGDYLSYVLKIVPDDGVVKKAETCII